MERGVDLDGLTEAQKDARIRQLAAQLQAALTRIAELAAPLNGPGKPPETLQNSSTPPSKAAKPETPEPPRDRGPLAENPSRVVAALLATCPHCVACWQVCLAHLPRDTQFGRCFQKRLRRTIIIGRRRPDLDDAPRAQHPAALPRRLDRILD